MARDSTAVVHLEDGLMGTIPQSGMDRGDRVVVVTLEDGRILEAPASAFTRRDDSSFDLPVRLDRIASRAHESDSVVIPVVAERLDVSTREVESGRVRIHKTVEEREETVDPPLFRDEIEVRRVPIEESANPGTPTEIRQEGDTLIVPVLEEVLVVTKTIRVREELRVTRKRVERHEPVTMGVRRESVTVDRLADGEPAKVAARES